MCPMCISTTAIAILSGSTSAGGLSALLVRKALTRRRARHPVKPATARRAILLGHKTIAISSIIHPQRKESLS
jgi:hypothetical protein